MALKNESVSTTNDREIVIERIFNAPQELVFKAWTTPENLVKWWGPYRLYHYHPRNGI